MTHIHRIIASDFQGFSFDEELPPRLLLTGPNGSGKTTRLLALKLAILGLDRDGLAPYATGDEPFVGFETTEGFKVMRRSRIQRDPLKVASVARVEPTQGEKTADAVNARIERELRPNLLALQLDRLFGLSGRERRRALLDAIGNGQGATAAQMAEMLDAKLAGNKAWPRIRAAARATGTAQEYLQALEGAAKAQASEYRERKRAAEGMLRTPAGGAIVQSVASARAALEAADKAYAELNAAAAAGRRGAEERARLVRQQTSMLTQFPEDTRAMGPDARTKAVEERSRAMATKEAEKEEEVEELAAAAKKLKAKAEAAKTTAQRWTGRLDALQGLLETCREAKGEDAGCPVCGGTGFSLDAFAGRIEKERHSLTSLVGRWESAQRDWKAADAKHAQQQHALGDVRLNAAAAEALVALSKQLLDIEARLEVSAAHAEAAFDEGALDAARLRQQEAQDALAAASKAEGERRARQSAQNDAQEADALRADAEAARALVGPSGLQGAMLSDPMRSLVDHMNEAWARPGTLGFRLEDARGEPDAEMILTRGNHTVALAQLSRGERATAMAALVTGLANMQPERMTIALLEAGEVDPTSLREMLGALGGDETIANIVVESPWPIPGPMVGQIEDETGFEVRVLPPPAAVA